jgi:predicted RecA/RadA family phage recombinase
MQTEIITHMGVAETVVLTAAASPGDIILTADSFPAICGMSTSTNMPYAIGDVVNAETDVIAWVPCASGTTLAVGALARWNNTTKLAVATGSGDFSLGTVVQAKVSGETRVKVRFNKVKVPTS